MMEDIPPFLSKDIYQKTFRSVFSIVIYTLYILVCGQLHKKYQDTRFLLSFSTYDIAEGTDQQFIAVCISYGIYIYIYIYIYIESARIQ